MKTNLEKEIDNLINIFIEKWIPKSYQHLIDTDENDGEALRDNIKELIDEAKQEERERIKKIVLPKEWKNVQGDLRIRADGYNECLKQVKNILKELK